MTDDIQVILKVVTPTSPISRKQLDMLFSNNR